MFYDNFITLCQKHNITPTRAVLNMGLSKSISLRWKKSWAEGIDQRPTGRTLQTIADYFGVSADYLLTGEMDKEPIPTTTEEKLTPQDSALAFALYTNNTEGVTKDMLDDVRRYAEFLKERNKN